MRRKRFLGIVFVGALIAAIVSLGITFERPAPGTAARPSVVAPPAAAPAVGYTPEQAGQKLARFINDVLAPKNVGVLGGSCTYTTNTKPPRTATTGPFYVCIIVVGDSAGKPVGCAGFVFKLPAGAATVSNVRGAALPAKACADSGL